MGKTLPGTHYRTYWLTWLLLLILTLAMLGSEMLSLPEGLLVTVLLVAMLVKASFIGANFMHLRYESRTLALIIAAGILATGAVLFVIIAFDGLRILRLS